MSVEQRETHPLAATIAEGDAKKKSLSHVEVKATSDLLSEVRKDHKGTLKHHVAPVNKQELLAAVRTEAPQAKKRLSHVETKAVSGLMSELRHGHAKADE